MMFRIVVYLYQIQRKSSCNTTRRQKKKIKKVGTNSNSDQLNLINNGNNYTMSGYDSALSIFSYVLIIFDCSMNWFHSMQ